MSFFVEAAEVPVLDMHFKLDGELSTFDEAVPLSDQQSSSTSVWVLLRCAVAHEME